MAAMDHFNRDPVVHTWSYKLDQAARYDSNFEIDELVAPTTAPPPFAEGRRSRAGRNRFPIRAAARPAHCGGRWCHPRRLLSAHQGAREPCRRHRYPALLRPPRQCAASRLAAARHCRRTCPVRLWRPGLARRQRWLCHRSDDFRTRQPKLDLAKAPMLVGESSARSAQVRSRVVFCAVARSEISVQAGSRSLCTVCVRVRTVSSSLSGSSSTLPVAGSKPRRKRP